MYSARTLAGLTLLCLTGCAAPSKPQLPQLVPPSLSQPCPPFLTRELSKNSDLALAYLEALAWGADCRARHMGLSGAAGG